MTTEEFKQTIKHIDISDYPKQIRVYGTCKARDFRKQ